MAYRAEIEIGVKGVRKLEQLRSELNKSSSAAESLNKVVGERGGLVQNIQNYVNNLNKAANTLNLVTAGTKAETKAIQEYITAEEKANAILQRKINLLDQERSKREEIRRVRKLTSAGIFETTRFTEPIGPAAASQVTLSTPLRGRLNQILGLEQASVKASNTAFQAALKHEQTLNNLEIQNDQNVFEDKLKQLELLAKKELALTKQTDAAILADFDKRLAARSAGKTGGGGGGSGGRLGGIASNAIIGGAFPLLFGQGGGAATGGAIGGAVGGSFGGAGGFAGSLLGTLLGQIAGQANQVKELAADIGFSAQQTQLLATAFKQAGTDFDKFQASVQNIRGLGLSLEEQADAVRLVSQLTETYSGKIDKVTNAFTSAFESGKVTQATLNQLTSEGIPIQEALAQKYGVSRTAILEMAKDGKISVQTLSDVLVDMGNKGLEAGQKPKSAFDQFTVALGNTATAVGGVAAALLNVLSPAINTIILEATQALNILTETINTELLRTQIQAKSGKILSPEKLQTIEKEAMSMAARRFPSKAQGRQLAAGPNIISPQAQADFQIIREQLIRNELQRFGYESGILKAPKPVVQGQIGRIQAPSQLPPSGGGGGGKGKKAGAERESRVPELARELALAQQVTVAENLIADARLKGDKELEIRLQGIQRETELLSAAAAIEIDKKLPAAEKALQTKIIEEKLLRSQADTIQQLAAYEQDRKQKADEALLSVQQENALLQAKINGTEKEYQLQRQLQELLATGVGPAQAAQVVDQNRLLTAEYEKQKLVMDKQKEIADGIAGTLGDTMVSAFDLLIQGSENWSNSLRQLSANVLTAIARQLIQIYVIEQALSFVKKLVNPVPAIPAPVPYAGTDAGVLQMMAFADGGNPPVGRPSIVGERGPELFVPRSSGTIVPNHQLGGSSTSVIVNVDASGTKAAGDDQSAKQLGVLISAAVQNEIVKQKRPGGLLA